jgi:twitching motility protein PilT
MANPAIRNLIRDSRSFEIPRCVNLHKEAGMQSLEDALAELVQKGTVTREDALVKTSNPKRLLRILERESLIEESAVLKHQEIKQKTRN